MPISDDDRAHGLGVAPVDAAPPLMMSPRRIELSSFLIAEPRFAVGLIFFGQRGLDRRRGGGDGVGAVLLVADGEGGAHLRFAGRLHLGVERRIVGRLEVEGLLRRVFGQVDDQVDHRLHRSWPNFTAPSISASVSS